MMKEGKVEIIECGPKVRLGFQKLAVYIFRELYN